MFLHVHRLEESFLQYIQTVIIMKLTPGSLFPDLPIGKLCFSLSPEKSIPPFLNLGSAWRGVLGWEMKQLICPFTKPQCSACSIQDSCPYFVLFEHEASLPGIQNAPRGYILYPEQSLIIHIHWKEFNSIKI